MEFEGKHMILISPYSRKLPDGKENAKNYPYWEELIQELKKLGFYILQIGIDGEQRIIGVDGFKNNLKLKELAYFIENCTLWISIDSFLQHYATYLGKKGIVIFGKSNPYIFGHPENINIYKDKKYFRKNQFGIWAGEPYDPDCFVKPLEIIHAINNSFLKI